MKLYRVLNYIVGLAMAFVITTSAYSQVPVTSAQSPVNFDGVDLSMLTNHASLVKYCFKQVTGVQISVSCGSDTGASGQQGGFYSYTNQVKSLDDIMATVLDNQTYWVQVTSPTDYFSISVNFYNTNDQNTVLNNQYNDQNSSLLFQGSTYSQPSQDQYGQWSIPSWASDVPMSLSPLVKIKIPGSYIYAARIIARDSYGNPYPVSISTIGDSFFFPSQFAGKGVIVLSADIPVVGQPGWWTSVQQAFSLQDGKPVQLTWVETQVLLQGSSDIVTFKDNQNLNTFVWISSGYGNVPLEIATFTGSTSNVVLNTYTSDGQSATSYVVEEAVTGNVKTYVVPNGATSVTTGTNAMKGVYYIVPQGINAQGLPGSSIPVIGKG